MKTVVFFLASDIVKGMWLHARMFNFRCLRESYILIYNLHLLALENVAHLLVLLSLLASRITVI